MAPSTMKAIKIIEGNKAELQDVPIPKLRDDYVLCKVTCVALNPTDWKHIARDTGKPGCTVGVDFSGVIEDIGPKVTKKWQKGDRVCGFVHGGNETQPEDDASTLGTGVITCGQSMYQNLGLPEPGNGKDNGFFLVYGGSTATGTLAVQYAVLSGYRVITTASEHNHSLLKALGAEEVFDYKDPSCGEKIHSYTNDSLTLALDCIAEGDSPSICCAAISSKGGSINYLLVTPHPRTDVENKYAAGYTVVGEAFDKMGRHWEAQPEDFEYAKRFFELTHRLVDAGQLAVHPKTVCGHGLIGVFDGLEKLMEGKVSGKKLVYRVEETPKDRKA
ncbi:hypothetical protein M409DRAFT_68030 [Zasmidium cellare ATCC 36951]|uniref:Enoyl reductase (ER) domain-containing protein n=1 Tax=Zasmidium cellare ATCC 36951 TaxID=1080233 RepID=A0A6A6CFB5_ZASCE|nr:uncharacterized protein M409DRAFT_68030 [Zasmidium cellare ATCC 36951]KAF2164096.1 hypothetical protein M409DRAFT_68030 [Zasmidium cellare ATCC 36951]